jgi:hypothetical protein
MLDRLRVRRQPAPPLSPLPSPAGQAPPVADAARPAVLPSDLERRRDRLASELVDLQWDLGGLAYEMASRDHFRLDVLARQAAELQRVDAELAEVERMLKLDHAGAAGACGSCGALYARGSVFCWQCGKDLMERGPVGTVANP